MCCSVVLCDLGQLNVLPFDVFPGFFNGLSGQLESHTLLKWGSLQDNILIIIRKIIRMRIIIIVRILIITNNN